jgi:hypothetical protein
MHSYSRPNLWIYSFFQISFYCLFSCQLCLPLPLFRLLSCLIPPHTSGSGGVQIISISVRQSFLQLVLPLAYYVCRRSGFDPFLYEHKSNATHVFPQHISAKHVISCRPTFYTIQHNRSNLRPIKLAFSFCCHME